MTEQTKTELPENDDIFEDHDINEQLETPVVDIDSIPDEQLTD